jgi:putative chitinase
MSLQHLQQKIGVAADGQFGPKTFAAARDYFELTAYQAAHFFGQCAHETGQFKRFTENLNYSATGLMRVWPSRFSPMSVALAYANDPEAIANRAYADRMGNGPASSGDGWFFRGRGALQLTGRANYTDFSVSSNKFAAVLDDPDLVATEYSFDSAAWFFTKARLWAVCNRGIDDTTIEAVTRKINGGTHGLRERTELTKRFYGWMG